MSSAPTSPKKGDGILFCPHLGTASGLHWWYVGDIGFERPDGSVGHAKWIAACDRCFTSSGGKAMKVPIAGDGAWDKGSLKVTKSS